MVEKLKPRAADLPDTAHLAEITVINPKTEQVITTTVKIFESLYRDKEIQVVTRGTIKDGAAVGVKVAKVGEPASQTGSAASIAQKLGIEKAPDEMPTDNADSGVASSSDVPPEGAPPAEPIETKTFAEAAAAQNQTDENDTDSNVPVASESGETSGSGRRGRPKINRSA